MIKITKKTDYGLTFLAALAKKSDERQSLRAIAKEYQLPYKFIGQIASEFMGKGIITSKEGSMGGYQLAKDPKQISLLEVIEALEGQPVKVDCLQGKSCPRQKTCCHHDIVANLAQVINESLAQKTVADLMR